MTCMHTHQNHICVTRKGRLLGVVTTTADVTAASLRIDELYHTFLDTVEEYWDEDFLKYLYDNGFGKPQKDLKIFTHVVG